MVKTWNNPRSAIWHALETLAQLLRSIHDTSIHLNPAAIDWGPLIREACREGLGGLLTDVVDRNGWMVPPSELQQLRNHMRETQQRNFRMMHRTVHVVKALQDAGVDVLLLKGGALLVTIYDRFDQRAMTDVDLLIHPQDARLVGHVLAETGFRRGSDQVRDDFFPNYYYETEYISRTPWPVRVDLHAHPLRPLRYMRTVPESAMWHETDSTVVNGVALQLPSIENMLIHLTAHAACHGGRSLRWLYDIKRLIEFRSDAIDWDKVVGRSRSWGLSLALLKGLQMTEEWLGLWIPPGAARRLRRAPVGFADRLTLWHAPRDEHHPVGHVIVNALCTPGLRFRAGYLSSVLFPGSRHMRSVYPYRHRGWLTVAHLFRWVRAPFRMFLPNGCVTT